MFTAWSRACRYRDLSSRPNGAGPPVISPVERMCSMIERVARAEPMLSAVKGRPVGFSTWAPAFRQRLLKEDEEVLLLLL